MYKNFGGYEKGYTFAPAKEESIASKVERNNTYLDIMLYSTKEDLKNRVKPEVNNLKVG